MAFLPVNAAFPDTSNNAYPMFNFQEGILTIPRVDTDEQAGNFQDAVFKIKPDGTWRLLDFRTTALNPDSDPQIDKVEVVITDSSPVQVFLKLTGAFSNGCGEFGQISQRLQGSRFEVIAHAKPIPDGTVCTMEIKPFEQVIALSVFGLPEGTYEFSVNGNFDGSFELTQDNGL
ncbi:MAG: hypothetical protein CVV13_02140 [Gammaproteobacteria bacterium HGW-Gammaproteobacteria-3]|nr:MAG: hypothetical protein CVV13_02140 [Gammaproteobacteria bacterium HGW-Gammaproteobacteria-3]